MRGRPGKVQLGDVIAAERLYYHDTGKQTREDGKPWEHQQDLRTFNLRPDWKVELERMKPAELFRGQPWLAERPMITEWRARRALWALERGAAEPWREVDGALKDGEWRRILEVLREEKWLDGIELTDAGRAEAKRRRFEYPGDSDLSPHGDLLPFKLHAAPLTSGNQVIEDASIWGFVSQAMRKTLSLDLEAAALGAAAHYLRGEKLEFLVMKGVMDFANHGRDDHFKEFAARASRLYRPLAEQRPDAFGPDLARSLTNLGKMQHAMGQREAALASTQEAVGLYRALAEQRPDACAPDLARSLANLGAMQSALGQREAALASTQEAVRLFRTLAEQRPDAFAPDLAGRVSNLGTMQSELGQREAALASTQEAVRLYRPLAEQRSDAFGPNLARSLTNLGAMQHAMGQREAALASTQEAVRLRRALAEQHPDACAPDLATSLTNLGMIQSELGQREAALASTQEAVGLC